MRIKCPFCGDRAHSEFAYLGDAGPTRPIPGDKAVLPEAAAVHDYVYLRNNPAGAHREFWQHSGGCRAWVVVERDMTTHAVGRVEFAGPEADRRGSTGR